MGLRHSSIVRTTKLPIGTLWQRCAKGYVVERTKRELLQFSASVHPLVS
ncbi:hypothetical protein RUA4292_01603 [Ruegeria atlantica]|uniref:Uncharacterized protein n=1 Tax=Ruegeria atlantica TaxID=81569 RepID=A0A0P1ECM5_9RHOB|nr:hypothetical protein RUA4292_01603 [Ruegeria atlantica]